jgi:hypothetical protein
VRRLPPILGAFATAVVLAVAAAALPARGAAEAPPWAGPRLAPSAFRGARIAVDQWRVAGNRTTCWPLALASLGTAGRAAVPRRAVFSGGWAVAYDLPRLRSAFGVAGAGIDGSDADTRRWPSRIAWSDGSAAGYGPEGGTGPQLLAYVHVTGQGCLYNVWSQLGEAHLLGLLRALRWVETGREVVGR